MPVTAGHLQVHIRGQYIGQRVEVVQWYRLDGAAFLTATVLGVLEAYWNDIKDEWRAYHAVSANDTTLSLFGREPGFSGQYAEFVVPPAEQQGTRPSGTLGDFLPPMSSTAIKLTVGSGETRPGQKRIWGLCEADQVAGSLTGGIITAANNAAAIFSVARVLGAPVATGAMIPEIVRYDNATGTITASQDVTGHILSAYVSTQNTRKFGRGV